MFLLTLPLWSSLQAVAVYSGRKVRFGLYFTGGSLLSALFVQFLYPVNKGGEIMPHTCTFAGKLSGHEPISVM